MLLNECVLICTNLDGTKRVWLYDIDAIRPGDEWRVRVWPQDAVTPEDGGKHFELRVTRVDEHSACLEYTPSETSKRIGDWERSIVAATLYAVLPRRLNKRFVSGRATDAWRYLASINEADEIEPGGFVVEGRSGLTRPTQFGPLPERPAPTSEAEFESLMHEVDRRLQDQKIAIPGRQLVARAEVSKILASQLSPVATKRDPNVGAFEGDDLVIRMDRWIENRYGERLLVDFTTGRVAVLLRGAIWVFKLPWAIGRFTLIASRTRASDKVEMRAYRADDPEEANRPSPVMNVLDSLVGLPEGLKQALTDDELRELHFAFDTGMSAFHAMRAIQNTPYIREAIADHLAAADHLSAPAATAHPGLAKYAAHQAVEKTYKAFLAVRKVDVPKIHELTKLSKRAAEVGLHPADRELVTKVECDAGARYGETKVTMEEAVVAHHAALDLSWYIAEEIKRVTDDGQ